jgi:hypothetical protein
MALGAGPRAFAAPAGRTTSSLMSRKPDEVGSGRAGGRSADLTAGFLPGNEVECPAVRARLAGVPDSVRLRWPDPKVSVAGWLTGRFGLAVPMHRGPRGVVTGRVRASPFLAPMTAGERALNAPRV